MALRTERRKKRDKQAKENPRRATAMDSPRRSALQEEVRQTVERIAPANRWRNGLDWPIIAWMLVIHLGALAAPFFVTWKAVGLGVVLAWMTGSLGVCMGYHRLLTHSSFTTYRPLRWVFAFIGGLSGEGSALTWVANHRKHHLFSDKDGDPHSPRDGKWWSHMLWFMPDFGRMHYSALTERYAPDLVRDPVMRGLHKLFLPLQVLSGVLMYAVGYWFWDHYTAISFVVWGMFVRLLYVFHITWFVNSASHIWGYRNYETSDDSRNLWWVGLTAFGEGWHNNHHAYQRVARHGHKWWEFDLTYLTICLMEKVGLAWNVVHEVPKHQRPA